MIEYIAPRLATERPETLPVWRGVLSGMKDFEIQVQSRNKLADWLRESEQAQERDDAYHQSGQRLAAAIDRGIAKASAGAADFKFAEIKSWLAGDYLDQAISDGPDRLFHLASFLATTGEFLRAGKALNAHSKQPIAIDVSAARYAIASREAARAAMRATKAKQKLKWVKLVAEVGSRIRENERSWPVSDTKLEEQIRESAEFVAFGKSAPAPAASTVRAEIPLLKLDAETWRERLRTSNKRVTTRSVSRTKSKKKSRRN